MFDSFHNNLLELYDFIGGVQVTALCCGFMYSLALLLLEFLHPVNLKLKSFACAGLCQNLLAGCWHGAGMRMRSNICARWPSSTRGTSLRTWSWRQIGCAFQFTRYICFQLGLPIATLPVPDMNHCNWHYLWHFYNFVHNILKEITITLVHCNTVLMKLRCINVQC